MSKAYKQLDTASSRCSEPAREHALFWSLPALPISCTPASYLLAFGVAGGGVGLWIMLPLKWALKWLEMVLAEGVRTKVLSRAAAAAL